MSIAIFVAGLAGLIGAVAHSSAKDDNRQALSIAEDAQQIYDNAKSSLESAKEESETALLSLGNEKRFIGYSIDSEIIIVC